MIVTAQNLLNSAARLGGILSGAGASLTAQESADGLNVLNELLESWNLENFLIYAHTNSTFNLSANVGTYSIGTGQTFNTTRPIGIRTGYGTISGVDQPFLMIGDAEFNQISVKSLTGAWPQVANYTASYPYGSITFWPIPAQAMTVTLGLDVPLTSVASLSTSIDLPNGYSKLLRYRLAIELCNEFQIPVPPNVAEIASKLEGNIKVANLPDDVLNYSTEWSTGVVAPYWYGRVI
jgi:hypothetical protein